MVMARLAQAMPAAPAPLTTILTFSIFLPTISSALSMAGAGDDRRAVLVIVEDRDVHDLLQLFLDVEALGPLDVLEVDAAEGRLENLDGADDLVGILGVQLDVEDVDVGKALEEDPFAFHHRFAGERADVAQAENGGAVGDDGDQVPLGGVLIGEGRDPSRFPGKARRLPDCRPATSRGWWHMAWW